MSNIQMQTRSVDQLCSAPGLPDVEPTRRLRLSGQWLSIVDLELAPKAQTEILRSPAPRVLRIVEGTLYLWRYAGRKAEHVELSTGAIHTIATGETYAYANPADAPVVFSVTVDAAEALREGQGVPHRTFASLAA